MLETLNIVILLINAFLEAYFLLADDFYVTCDWYAQLILKFPFRIEVTGRTKMTIIGARQMAEKFQQVHFSVIL